MIVLQYLLAIIGLSLIIIVHEFGHFIFAKSGRMYIHEFFIGFGPRLFKFKSKAGTVYGLKAVPVGGYVKVMGMDRNEVIPEDKKQMSYQSKPFYKKFFTIFGGAGFNVIFAIVLIGIFLAMGTYEPSTTIEYVQPETPAEASGIEAGDKVIAINGEKITTWDEFASLTQNKPGEEVVYTLIRDGREIKITPVLDTVEGVGYLGIGPEYVKVYMSFPEIVKESFVMTWDIIATYFKLFGKLFTGQIPFDQARPVSPIGVVSIFQQSISMGMQNFILFLALVSILIGFGNLLPILPLDGGHILILIIETIRKKPVPQRVLEVTNSIGIFIMVAILITGFVFDIINPFNLNNM
ncbi:RIP metalloprotease [Actinomycetota bacterium]